MYEYLKGKSISFEGGEGTGKSTLLKLLFEILKENDLNVILSREPGGNKICEQIRNIILDKENKDISSETECLLFAASRAQHLNDIILPSVKENKTVLLDRFIDSSLVYQGCMRNLGVENVYNLNLFATKGWMPDLTILIDLEPEIGLNRISKNNRDINRLDLLKLNDYQKIRKGYLDLAHDNPKRIKVINGDNTIENILNEILHILDNKFNI